MSSPENLTIALVLLDGGGMSYPVVSEGARVLVVIRDPETNETHPNVVSVPTARAPMVLHDSVWPENSETHTFGWTTLTEWNPMRGGDGGGSNPTVFVVKSLLAQKLGLADALERKEISYLAGPVARTTGFSFYSEERAPCAESLTMVTILVAVTQGADKLVKQTASYSWIGWVPVQDFVSGAAGKDLSRLGLDFVEFCIHGLCIASAHDVLASAVGRVPYRRSPESLGLRGV